MFERFTESARRAVVEANGLAAREGAREVAPAHLLRALLEGSGSPARGVLVAVGASPERVLAGLGSGPVVVETGVPRSALGRLAGRLLGRGRTPVAAATRRSLERALRAAIALGSGRVGPEHLLLGVAESGDPVTTAALSAAGVDARSLPDVVRRGVTGRE